MSNVEIILLIVSTLSFSGIVFMIILQKQPKKDDVFLHSVQTKFDEVKFGLQDQIHRSLFDFNDHVNQKLSENSEKTSTNIADLRLQVNEAVSQFRDSLSTRLQTDFQGLTAYLEGQMSKITQSVDQKLSQEFQKTNQTFIQISERVKVIDEAQKKIEDLSTEMVSLQKILSNNQSRGLFGEYQLNQLLFSIYGENDKLYQTQYTIREQRGKSESVRADAVIFMPEPNGHICVDSKFPYSSIKPIFDQTELTKEEEEKVIQGFGADVKKHITDIASKYIISGVTADFALMFVPTDAVLSILHAKLPNVVEYARSKNITIVSPTTLIPLLSSFKAVKIDFERNKHIAKIRKELLGLNKDFLKFVENWEKLTTAMDSITRHSSAIDKDVKKITTKFDSIKNVEFMETDADSTDFDETK